jgi:hypothetical protein
LLVLRASRGPFATVEGLFTVLICIPCLEVRQPQLGTCLSLYDSIPGGVAFSQVEAR